MTSLYLLLWIIGGITLQLAIYLAIRFWQHWVAYQAMAASLTNGQTLIPVQTNSEASDTLAAAWSGLREFIVTHKVMENAAQDICSFYVSPQDNQSLPPFFPGQFLTFRLDVTSESGALTSITRCYSLSDAPQPNSYRVSIKRARASGPHPSGRSSNFFHDKVQVGTRLQVRAPAGHFYIDRGDAPVVLIGGGIGITPMLSMLHWCLVEQPVREIWLFYGARNGSELMAQAQLEALADQHPNFHLQICLSHPLPADQEGVHFQHQGRIDVALFRRLLPLKPYHFYICGPTAMLESLVPALEDWGVPDARIHFEAFGPASVKRRNAVAPLVSSLPTQASDEPAVVTFAKTGKQLPWQSGGGTLLDFAESHGIAVNSGCRAGGCGSCQTTIRSGEVIYQQAPDFDPEPGTCLLCVCTPKTSVTLEL